MKMPGNFASFILMVLATAAALPAQTRTSPSDSPPSPVTRAMLGIFEKVSGRFWPGVSVVPVMSSSATDGAFVRNAGIPVYGLSGIFSKPGDSRLHGRDERIEIRRFYEGLEFGKAIIEAVVSMR